MTIQHTSAAHIAALQTILDATELFPSDMLPEMIAPFLGSDTGDELWLTSTKDGAPQGFCYARAEDLTDGTWNMLAIAVAPALQGQGSGAALTAALEEALRAKGVRILIVDTSGTDDFTATRAFYAKNGYTQEARIRDFWAEGDDKVIFRKAL